MMGCGQLVCDTITTKYHSPSTTQPIKLGSHKPCIIWTICAAPLLMADWDTWSSNGWGGATISPVKPTSKPSCSLNGPWTVIVRSWARDAIFSNIQIQSFTHIQSNIFGLSLVISITCQWLSRFIPGFPKSASAWYSQLWTTIYLPESLPFPQYSDRKRRQDKNERKYTDGDEPLSILRSINLLPNNQRQPSLKNISHLIHGRNNYCPFFIVFIADFMRPASYLSVS